MSFYEAVLSKQVGILLQNYNLVFVLFGAQEEEEGVYLLVSCFALLCSDLHLCVFSERCT